MNKQLLMAINQICAERNLKPQVVIEAVEQALVSAYKRNFGNSGSVEAKLDPESGDMRIYARLEVVAADEIVDPKLQLSPDQAAKIDPTKTNPGDVILIERTPEDFGRIAAQTAKQVILQRIREAERDAVYEDYADREGELVQGVVRSIEQNSGNVVVSLDGGRAEGILSRSDQIPGERHRINASVLAYVSEVARGTRGPVIHLSRSHRNMLRRLLEKEVPEIKQGAVEIKAIAREAGSRSKIAVTSTQPGVDPVGSCVGMRGVRIQNIVNELSGEKIDVVEWHPDQEQFVAHALSPARVTDVLLFYEQDKTAMVVVPDNQLSLAIGKEGQNARLVAKLTGWRIDIKSETEAAAEGLDEFERQRTRMERKERSRADDLLEAARRILAEEDVIPADLIATDLPKVPALEEEVEVAAAAFDDIHIPDELEAAEPMADLESAVTEQAETPAAGVEEDMLALAARLSEAMRSMESDQLIDHLGVDEETFARIFGSKEEEEEEEEEDAKGESKKKRRKDRQMVFDENKGRVVAIKRHKTGRGGSRAVDLGSLDDIDDFE